jgi:hypothetical protein
VQSDPRGTTLKTLQLGGSRDVVWQQFVEDVSAPSLSFDRATARWRVMGRGRDESLVRAEGIIGTSGVQTTRWRADDTFGGSIEAVTAAGPDVLVFETRYGLRPLAHVIPWRWTWLLLQPFNEVSRYATVHDRGYRTLGESKLDVDCMADVLDGALACYVHDGTRTRIVRIDAGTGHVEGIGWLDGRFVSDQNVNHGWLTGWAGARVVAINLSTGDALHLVQRGGATSLLSVANGQLAAVTVGGDHFTVRLYPLPADMLTADPMRAQRTAGR